MIFEFRFSETIHKCNIFRFKLNQSIARLSMPQNDFSVTSLCWIVRINDCHCFGTGPLAILGVLLKRSIGKNVHTWPKNPSRDRNIRPVHNVQHELKGFILTLFRIHFDCCITFLKLTKKISIVIYSPRPYISIALYISIIHFKMGSGYIWRCFRCHVLEDQSIVFGLNCTLFFTLVV